MIRAKLATQYALLHSLPNMSGGACPRLLARKSSRTWCRVMYADVECIAHSMCKRLGPLWARGKCKVGINLHVSSTTLIYRRRGIERWIQCSAYRSNYWICPGPEFQILFQVRSLSSRRDQASSHFADKE